VRPSLTPGSEDRFEIDVFAGGEEGYHTYQIPSLLVTPRGALLAFYEGRKTGASDHGDIDLVLRRNSDGGRTWHKQELVHEEGGTRPVAIGNPCPVVD
jgi:sialidase-1